MGSTGPFSTTNATEADRAAEADLAEQGRDLVEGDLDPLAPAAAAVGPSAAALDVGAADEADLAEQAYEVGDDEDDERA